MSQNTSNSQPVAQADLGKTRITRGSSCFSFETKPAENWQKFRKASSRELPRTNLRLHLKNQRTGENGFEKVDRLATSTTASATTLSKTSSVSSSYSTKRRQLIPRLTLFVLIMSCHLLVHVAAANIAAAPPVQSQAQQQQPRSRETLHAIYIQMLANQSQLKQQSDNRPSETEPQQQNHWQFEPQAAQIDASSPERGASGRWAPTNLDMDLHQPYDVSSDRVPLPARSMPDVSSGSSGRQYAQPAPTTPTLNHQLMPPSQPFYEFSFAPTNALILEPTPQQENYNNQQHNPVALQANSNVANLTSASLTNTLATSASEGVGGTQRAPPNALHSSLPQKPNQTELPTRPTSNSLSKSEDSSQKKSSLDVVERSIEPRQNRRVLSRILQKAEWNNLFVKLSKVLLKHLLEMALKDIVGKQSGDAASDSGAADSTTGRKKFDTQSELADLFKDFVKTAVSNL